jgi:hypothetical protein
MKLSKFTCCQHFDLIVQSVIPFNQKDRLLEQARVEKFVVDQIVSTHLLIAYDLNKV